MKSYKALCEGLQWGRSSWSVMWQAEEEELIQPGAEMAAEDLSTGTWCLQGGN